MSMIVIAGLMLGSPVATDLHRVTVDHRGSPVTATYRPDVRITHRQVGAAGPGGRAQTLRCRWTAEVAVHREARHPAGTASRTIVEDAPFGGSRPGWCTGQRAAIAGEVAARREAIARHVMAVAERDRSRLIADIDRTHPPRG